MPPVGIGTIAWGDESYGFGTRFREKDLEDVFRAAVGGGVGWFDTAEVYGYKSGQFEQSAEHMLGHFVENASTEARLLNGAGGGLPEAFVGSKVFTVPWTNVIMGGGVRMGRTQLVDAGKATVERLGRPLDLWSIHFPFPTYSQSMYVDALVEAMDLGLTKAVGVSNYDAGQMEEAQELLFQRGIALAANQVKYSVLDRKAQRSGLLLKCADLGVKLVAYCPLESGKLTGTDNEGDKKIAELRKLLEFIGAINGGKTPTQVAINYLVCRGALPIVGCASVAHVDAAAGAVADGWRLDNNELDTIDEKLDYLQL
jgi:aryl-alcohol dehydrogenase-like predicted oxidoreductase